MVTRIVNYGLSCMIPAFALVLAAGCSEEAALAGTTSEFAKPIERDAKKPAELREQLDKADRLDGKVDKIIVRCANCSLNMDGKPEHALKVLDYKLYFCRAACANTFAKNLTQSVREMKIPEGAPAKDPKSDQRNAALHKKMLSKLAKADRLDGKADKVVVRCASCSLNMDGTDEHTVKALDYTLQFCKEDCAKRFAKDITKSVLALNVPDDPPTPDSDDEETKKQATIHAKIMGQLAAADRLDGKADKTVVRCPGCSLSMDGIAEHALEAHGYTIYFCREGCAERFGKDIQASILAMEIPEE